MISKCSSIASRPMVRRSTAPYVSRLRLRYSSSCPNRRAATASRCIGRRTTTASDQLLNKALLSSVISATQRPVHVCTPVPGLPPMLAATSAPIAKKFGSEIRKHRRCATSQPTALTPQAHRCLIRPTSLLRMAARMPPSSTLRLQYQAASILATRLRCTTCMGTRVSACPSYVSTVVHTASAISRLPSRRTATARPPLRACYSMRLNLERSSR